MFAPVLRASKGFTLVVVCIAIFSDVLIYGLLVPVLPFALVDRLGVRDEDVQKWNSILLAVLGIAIFIGSIGFGYLSDRIGSRRLPFTLGLAMVASATMLFALCRSFPMLIIARLLQGLATGVVVTLGHTLVFDKVGHEQLGHASGLTSMSLSIGWFVGPVLGGVVYEHAGYIPVFMIPIVLICIEIVLRLLIIEDCGSRSRPQEHARQADETNATENTPLFAHTLPTKELVQQKNTFLVLLSSWRFVVGMAGYSILSGLMVAFDAVLPVFLKDTFDFNSQQVSLVFLALTVPMLLSPIFGALTDRLGSTKWPAVAGLVLTIPGFLFLRSVDETKLPLLIGILIEIGICFAIGLPPLAAEVMHVVGAIEDKAPGIFGPYGASAQAYGLTSAGLGMGCVLGPIGAGFVRVQFGWAAAVTSMAIVSGVTAVFVCGATGGSLWKTHARGVGSYHDRHPRAVTRRGDAVED